MLDYISTVLTIIMVDLTIMTILGAIMIIEVWVEIIKDWKNK